jgi:type II secretory pathway component GspD/PulD (secretin)
MLISSMMVFGVATEVKINTIPSSGSDVKGTEQAFKDGELFYNAVPSTPAPGTAVKVIDSKDDVDFIVKVYELKTPGTVYEIKDFLTPTISKENGKIKTSYNVETKKEYLIITAPAFQFPFLDDAIQMLDQPGTKYAKSGSKRLVYTTYNREATELEELINETLVSGYGDVIFDDTINKIMIKDAPSVYDRCVKYLPYFDVPPEMVRIECEIVEFDTDDDFNFGIAWDAWKEALPENVDMTIDWSHDKADPGNGPGSWATYIAQNVQMSGIRPKAVANIVNYLVRTGKARVLSRPTIVAVNGEEAEITSLDNVNYKAYSEPEDTLDKQAQVGLTMTIEPMIAQETLRLDVEASLNSVVGWSSGGNPIINTRSTTANVVLKDGELFALSGLRKDNITKVDERIPFLGRLPLVGYAFRHEIDRKTTSEILILLTPKKVTASQSVENRERELLQQTEDEMNAPREGYLNRFNEKFIKNMKPIERPLTTQE